MTPAPGSPRPVEALLTGLLAAAVFFVALESAVAGLLWSEPWLLLLLGVTAAFGGVVAVARRLAQSGRIRAALRTVVGALMVALGILAAAIPDLFGVYLCLTVVAGALVLPRFDGAELRVWLSMCWLTGVGVTVAGAWAPGLAVEHTGFLATISVLGVAWCSGLALFLVYQYSLWMRSANADLHRVNAELRDRTASLDAALADQREARQELLVRAAELQRSNDDLEQFAYVASHDLQEPLRMVASYTQLLKRRYGDVLDERGVRYVDYAVDGAVRMRALVNDLLAYARAGNDPTLVPLELDEVLAEVEVLLAGQLAEAGATVHRSSLPSLYGDRAQLVAVFQNLVSNAVKYARPGVRAEVRIEGTTDADGTVRVVVADNGIGFAPEFRERVFAMFQRLHEPGRYPGTGVGLALVRKLVARHHGRVWAESTPGEGSRFTVELPRLTPGAGA